MLTIGPTAKSRIYLIVKRDSKIVHISNIDITNRDVEVMLDAQRYEKEHLQETYGQGIRITQYMGQGKFLKNSAEAKYLKTYQRVLTIEEILTRVKDKKSDSEK
jgi:hypothetical protein